MEVLWLKLPLSLHSLLTALLTQRCNSLMRRIVNEGVRVESVVVLEK